MAERAMQRHWPIACFLVAVWCPPAAGLVVCGMHKARNCAECPQGHGASWCNGECTWDHAKQICVQVGTASASTEKDLYELLEVDDNADSGDIKRSYRKLSVKYHPDKNPGEADRFNSIRDAYEVLSNPDKRVLYDTGGIQAVKDGEQGKAETGEAVEKAMDVTLVELYLGVRRKLPIRRRVICRKCRSTRDPKRCKGCNACPPGKKIVHIRQGHMLFRQEQEVPSSEDCRTEVTDLDVSVDKGANAGDKIVFRHMGPQKPGQIPGDVTVVLKARKETNALEWQRLGNDLRVKVNLTLRESLLGFTRKLTHLDGHSVEFNTQAVTAPGQVLRISHEGMPLQDVSSQFGDLYVQIGVEFPKSLSQAQRKELENVKALKEDVRTFVDSNGRRWEGEWKDRGRKPGDEL